MQKWQGGNWSREVSIQQKKEWRLSGRRLSQSNSGSQLENLRTSPHGWGCKWGNPKFWWTIPPMNLLWIRAGFIVQKAQAFALSLSLSLSFSVSLSLATFLKKFSPFFWVGKQYNYVRYCEMCSGGRGEGVGWVYVCFVVFLLNLYNMNVVFFFIIFLWREITSW